MELAYLTQVSLYSGPSLNQFTSILGSGNFLWAYGTSVYTQFEVPCIRQPLFHVTFNLLISTEKYILLGTRSSSYFGQRHGFTLRTLDVI